MLEMERMTTMKSCSIRSTSPAQPAAVIKKAYLCFPTFIILFAVWSPVSSANISNIVL